MLRTFPGTVAPIVEPHYKKYRRRLRHASGCARARWQRTAQWCLAAEHARATGSNLLIGLTAPLEVQLQSKLNDARRTRSRDLAKGGTPSLVVWVMKLCVVEGVEEL